MAGRRRDRLPARATSLGGTPPAFTHPLPIVGVGASAGGLEAFSQLLERAARRRPAWRSCSCSTSPRSTRARCRRCSARVDAAAGRAGRPRACASSRTTSTSSRRTSRWSIARRRAAPRRRGPTTARSTCRSTSSSARSPTRAQDRADRRRPLRHRVRRRRRAARDQGGGRHHDRAGPGDGASTTACRAPRSRPGWSTWCCRRAEIAARAGRASPRTPSSRPRAAAASAEATPPSSPRDDQLARIFALLRSASGVDFTHYKLPTIHRRLQRRMVLHKITERRRSTSSTSGAPGRGPAPLPGHPDPRHPLLPRARVVRGARDGRLPADPREPARRRRRSASGCPAARPARRRTRSRSRCSSTSATGAERVPDPDLRHRHQRAGDRARARRRLPREHRRRRVARAAAALLHQGRRRLPDQQARPRPLRLRPPGPHARPAVLASST